MAHIFLEDARQRVDLESLWVEQLGASIQVVEQPETLNTMKTMRLDEDFDGAEEDNGR